MTEIRTLISQSAGSVIKLDAIDWVNVHREAKNLGYVRLEWLTAVHDVMHGTLVVSALSRIDASNQLLIQTRADDESLESLDSLFSVASFHEREVAQMFGISFLGASDTSPAFAVDFDGFPLRRDFVLKPRVEINWPGNSGSDINERRRTTAVPGINKEWQS